MDVLSIAGNILAGTWLSRARVLLNGQGGTRAGRARDSAGRGVPGVASTTSALRFARYV
jgi:hypothetical protein